MGTAYVVEGNIGCCCDLAILFFAELVQAGGWPCYWPIMALIVKLAVVCV